MSMSPTPTHPLLLTNKLSNTFSGSVDPCSVDAEQGLGVGQSSTHFVSETEADQRVQRGVRSKDQDAENSEDANTELQIHVLRCELELERMAKEAAEKELAKLRSSLEHVFGTRVVKLQRKFVCREAVRLMSPHMKLFTREQSGGTASRSGQILVGDRLLTLNGVPVKGLLPTTVSEMMQGAEDSEVVMALETAKFSIDSLRWLVDSSVQKQLQSSDEHKSEHNYSASENMSTDAFTAALVTIPSYDWCRTWPAERTILLRMTSKRVKEAVDKLRPPAVVRVRKKFWIDDRNGCPYKKMEFILNQIAKLSACFCITKLDLSPCDIAGPEGSFVHPECLEAHAYIQSFMHQHLPSVLSLCPLMLCHLDLSNNDFGSAGVMRLLGVLAQCQALSHLNLRNNHIGDAGAEILSGVLGQCPALAHLDLSLNAIGADGAGKIAGVLAQCPVLSTLNLNRNQIRAQGAGSIAEVLPYCRALSRLDLQHNQIAEEGTMLLARVLAQCPELSHLDLRDNEIGAEGAGELAAVLPQLPALCGLYLGNNWLRDDGVRKIADVLPYCRALSRLDLTRTGTSSPETAVKLAEMLVQCPKLSHLDLSGNYQFFSEVFSEVLGQCRALSYLDLGNCKTGDEGVRRLAQGQGLCATLTYLDLGYTTQDSGGPISTLPSERLAELLGQCPSLSTVILAGNYIGHQGAGMIAEVLPRSTALSVLNLGHNRIRSEGAGVLAGVLGQCAALAHLDLSYNEIGDEGAGMLAKVLCRCTSLARLNLRNNAIRDKGAVELAKVLGLCPELVHLNLQDNDIRDEGAVSLAEAVRECTTLAELCLGANRITPYGAEVLTSAYRLYTTLTYLCI